MRVNSFRRLGTLTMKHKSASIQPDLLEQNEPRFSARSRGSFPGPLAEGAADKLVEPLLLEIAAVLATEEVGDDQDHR